MKALNNVKFISNAAQEMKTMCEAILADDTFESAQNTARGALGFVNCMIVYLNTMLATENNDYTADLDKTLDGWCVDIYQCLAEKAEKTNQPPDVIVRCLKNVMHIKSKMKCPPRRNEDRKEKYEFNH